MMNGGGGGGKGPPPATSGAEGVTLGQVVLEEPVNEDDYLFHLSDEYYENNYGIYNQAGSRNISWEYKTVQLTRVPGFGFGIAVSGGKDNPHFANGDPAIAISDVLRGGPAEGKLNVNDRIISANGVKLENVEYGTAVQVLRDSGPTVSLIIKRRIVNHHQKVSLNKLTQAKLKNIQPSDYGLRLVIRVYVEESRHSSIVEGDEIVNINGVDVAKLFDFRRGVGAGSCGVDKAMFGVVKSQTAAQVQAQQQQQQEQQQQQQLAAGGTASQPQYHHQQQQSYDSTINNGNLYVQPPTRHSHSHSRSHHQREASVQRSIDTTPPPPPPPPPPPNHPLPHYSSPRYINFVKKTGPIGLKLIGGNVTGVFIAATHPSTPAASSGLLPGDLIIRVNDIDFSSLTREQALDTLSAIKPNSLVSFIVRFVENYKELLQTHAVHDRVHYRLNYSSHIGKIDAKMGQVVLVYDTLTQSGGYEGVLLKSGEKVELLAARQAQAKEKVDEPYTQVHAIKATWPRPVLLLTPIRDFLYEKMVKELPNKFRLGEASPDVIHKSSQHLLLEINSAAELLKMIDLAPIVLSVKPDKALTKQSKVQQGQYASLLRPFNKHSSSSGGSKKSKAFEKGIEEFEGFVEKERTLELSSGDWLTVLMREIGCEQELDCWVSTNDQLQGHHQLIQMKQPLTTAHSTIPNYNLPVPNVQKYQQQQNYSHQLHHETQAVMPPQQQPQQPLRHNNQGGMAFAQDHPRERERDRSFYYQTPVVPSTSSLHHNHFAHHLPSQQQQLLAHSPHLMEEAGGHPPSPPPPPIPVTPPPQIDRSTKPSHRQRSGSEATPPPHTNNNPKPVPPPKPAHRDRGSHRNVVATKDVDSYYLNLPMNSKVFEKMSNNSTNPNNINNNSSVSNLDANGNNNSAFEIYRRPQQQPQPLPLQQPNTTCGTFDHGGGILTQRNIRPGQIPIELVIPEGAIPPGKSQTIWFHVVDNQNQDQTSSSSNLNLNGVQHNLISPLVKFGPENLRFQKPVEIRIPQYSRSTSGQLLLSNSSSNVQQQKWSRIQINSDQADDNDVKIVQLTVQQF